VSWVKLDDQFHSHPKVIAGGNEVAGVYARSLASCGAYHTDGFVSRRQAATFAVTRVLKKVTDAGLWEEVEPGEARTVTGRRDSGNRQLADVSITFDYYGFFIEDFLHHNPTREEAEAARAKRRSAGSKGGQAKAEADAQAFASQEAPQSASTPPTRPVLVSTSSSILLEREQVERDFFAYSKKIGLWPSQEIRALQLGPVGLEEAMLRTRSRQDVGNDPAYFDGVVKQLLGAQQAGKWKSTLPLEDRLTTYVRNAGWELTDAELAEELHGSGADEAMVARLLVFANELRGVAA
jgi:hypothetical protein